MRLNYFPANGLNSWTGYGNLELGLAKGLQSAGVDLLLSPDWTLPTLIVGNALWLTAPHVVNGRKWLLTMTESTAISQQWVELINEHAERVLAVSPHNIRVFRDCGVSVPIHYVGMGVEFCAPALHGGRRPDEPFTYLTYSYGDRRKGAELVAFAFKRAFSADDDVRLIIKARDTGLNYTWLDSLADDPQIEVVRGIQSADDWFTLMDRAQCFVFPSRGEGFGLPPRESTLIGMPTIATRWSGMADVDKWGIPVDVAGFDAVCFDTYEANSEAALWARPDDKHLERQMMWVKDHYYDARLIALKGRQYLQDNFNWHVVAGRIVSVMMEHGA